MSTCLKFHSTYFSIWGLPSHEESADAIQKTSVADKGGRLTPTLVHCSRSPFQSLIKNIFIYLPAEFEGKVPVVFNFVTTGANVGITLLSCPS